MTHIHKPRARSRQEVGVISITFSGTFSNVPSRLGLPGRKREARAAS
jgi:hypothetical protein